MTRTPRPQFSPGQMGVGAEVHTARFSEGDEGSEAPVDSPASVPCPRSAAPVELEGPAPSGGGVGTIAPVTNAPGPAAPKLSDDDALTLAAAIDLCGHDLGRLTMRTGWSARKVQSALVEMGVGV